MAATGNGAAPTGPERDDAAALITFTEQQFERMATVAAAGEIGRNGALRGFLEAPGVAGQLERILAGDGREGRLAAAAAGAGLTQGDFRVVVELAETVCNSNSVGATMVRLAQRLQVACARDECLPDDFECCAKGACLARVILEDTGFVRGLGRGRLAVGAGRRGGGEERGAGASGASTAEAPPRKKRGNRGRGWKQAGGVPAARSVANPSGDGRWRSREQARTAWQEQAFKQIQCSAHEMCGKAIEKLIGLSEPRQSALRGRVQGSAEAVAQMAGLPQPAQLAGALGVEWAFFPCFADNIGDVRSQAALASGRAGLAGQGYNGGMPPTPCGCCAGHHQRQWSTKGVEMLRTRWVEASTAAGGKGKRARQDHELMMLFWRDGHYDAYGCCVHLATRLLPVSARRCAKIVAFLNTNNGPGEIVHGNTGQVSGNRLDAKLVSSIHSYLALYVQPNVEGTTAHSVDILHDGVDGLFKGWCKWAEEQGGDRPKQVLKTFKRYANEWCVGQGYEGGIKKRGHDHNVCPTDRRLTVGMRLNRLEAARAKQMLQRATNDPVKKQALEALLRELDKAEGALKKCYEAHMVAMPTPLCRCACRTRCARTRTPVPLRAPFLSAPHSTHSRAPIAHLHPSHPLPPRPPHVPHPSPLHTGGQ